MYNSFTLEVTVVLSINLKIPNTQVAVTSHFVLWCDGLLGFESLATHRIDVIPKHHGVSANGTLFSAMFSSDLLLNKTLFVPNNEQHTVSAS